MNIEKLDTLLQNKLQRVESEVHDNELNSVLEKMGVRKKGPGIYFMLGISVILLCAVLIVYNAVPKGSVVISVNESPVILEQEHKVGDREGKYQNSEKADEKVSVQPEHFNPEKQVMTHKTPGFGSRRERSEVSSAFSFPAFRESLIQPVFATDAIQASNENSSGERNPSIKGLEKNAYQYAAYQLQPLNVPDMVRPIPGSVTLTKAFGKFLSMAEPELSFWVSPMMSFENSSAGSGDQNRIHKDYINRTNGSEKPLLTMNSGVKLQFMLLPYLRMGTGIGYFQTGNTYNYDYRINDVPIIDSATGKIIAYIHKPNSSGKQVQASGRHLGKYIEIPVSCRLNILSSAKFSIGLEPSYALQILSGSSGEHIDPLTLDLSRSRSYKTRSGNIQLGIPVSFVFSDKMSFSLSPYYGQTTSNVSANVNENRQRMYTGIRLSLNYKLYNPTR